MTDPTLPPSLRKLAKARSEGRVAGAPELVGAVVLAAALLWFVVRREALAAEVDSIFDAAFAHAFRGEGAVPSLEPLALLCLVIIGVALISGLAATRGPLLSLDPVKPRMGRIAPQAGRLLNLRGWVDLLRTFVKTAVLGGIGVLGGLFILDRCNELGCMGREAADVALPLVGTMVAALVILGLVDAAVQRWLYRRDLRMTYAELREERRQG